MIAPNPNLLCKQAELYYYDFFCDESPVSIPDSIIDHIEQCQNCQKQISQLKAVLSQADDIKLEQGPISSPITVMLKLHFAYVGKRITCGTVRPFLPSLLDPALEVGIPTPITAHLDNCQQCTEDLETIRGLELSRTQLRRLSQLLAEAPVANTNLCKKAQKFTASVVSMIFSETNAEILKHLCKCTSCRKLFYNEREKMCGDMPKNAVSSAFPCENVSVTDIFDYVVPYGIDPANDQYSKFRKPLTLHLRTCPRCLTKMQHLHNTVYGIAERSESEVVTIYQIDESAKAEAAGEADELYTGFPIRVEKVGPKESVEAEHSAQTVDFTAALKQKLSAMNLKPLVKIAAAAVILIGIAFFINIPTAKAISIEQIYKAIEKIRNIYVAILDPEKTEPKQELWVSKSLNIFLIKTDNKLTLWDIPKLTRKSKYLDTTPTETTLLTDGIAADIKRTISGSLGLLPFSHISDIPRNSKWSRIANDGQDITADETEVYELTWTEKVYDGSLEFRKWRVFVDSKTNLPKRTEQYVKLFDESDYTLQLVRMVEYLSDSRMQTVLEELSF